jgi:hypothetical protein
LDPLRVLGQKSCQKNDHFLLGQLEKLIFHKNLDVFFLKFLNTHARNILFVDDTPYKFLFNDSCSVIFLESFESTGSNRDYLLSTVLPYLVLLHLSKFNVQTYMKPNPFGTIRSISWSAPYYNMLFEYCSSICDIMYCTKGKLNFFCDTFIIIFNISI